MTCHDFDDILTEGEKKYMRQTFLEARLTEINNEYRDKKERLQCLKLHVDEEPNDYWLFEMCLEDWEKEFLKIEREVMKIQRELSYIRVSPFDDQKIERARSADIALLFDEVRNAGTNRKKTLCPFHDDSHPSLILYCDDIPHYHCFVCGAHGDAISLLINRDGMSFNEAVDFLATF